MLTALWVFAFPYASAQEGVRITFVVHPSNAVSSLTQPEIADYYFKRTSRWPDGTKVRFIDQREGSAAKKAFNAVILHKTSRDIDLFWIGEKNSSGQGAPLQAPSHEMVLSTVASIPGAIGYVTSEEVDLERVKKISVTGVE